jgi:hypothetical protein
MLDMVDGCSMVFEQLIGELVFALGNLKGICLTELHVAGIC